MAEPISTKRAKELIRGLKDAILWEGDPDTLKFTYVSESAESILGYPLVQWFEEPDFWVNQE